jgi:hypothetical protein
MVGNTPQGQPDGSPTRVEYTPIQKLTSLEETNADEVIGALKYDRARDRAQEELNDTGPKVIRALISRLLHPKAHQQELDTKTTEILNVANDRLILPTEAAFIRGVFEAQTEEQKLDYAQAKAMLDNRSTFEKFRNSKQIQQILETTVFGISIGSVIGLGGLAARSEASTLARMALGATGGGIVAGGAIGGYKAWQRATREQYRASSQTLVKDLRATMNFYDVGNPGDDIASIKGFEDLVRAKVSAGNVVEALLLQSEISYQKHQCLHRTKLWADLNAQADQTYQEGQAAVNQAISDGKSPEEVEEIKQFYQNFLDQNWQELDNFSSQQVLESNPGLSGRANAIFERLKSDKQRKVRNATLIGVVAGATVGGLIGAAVDHYHESAQLAHQQASASIDKDVLKAAHDQVTEGFYSTHIDTSHRLIADSVNPEVVDGDIILGPDLNRFTDEFGRIQTRFADLLNNNHALNLPKIELSNEHDVMREIHQLQGYLAHHKLEGKASGMDKNDAMELARKLRLMEDAFKKPGWLDAAGDMVKKYWKTGAEVAAIAIGAFGITKYLQRKGLDRDLHLPKLPTFKKIELPKFKLPNLPKLQKIKFPKFPSLKVHLPDFKLPTLKKLELPKIKFPKLPTINFPKIARAAERFFSQTAATIKAGIEAIKKAMPDKKTKPVPTKKPEPVPPVVEPTPTTEPTPKPEPKPAPVSAAKPTETFPVVTEQPPSGQPAVRPPAIEQEPMIKDQQLEPTSPVKPTEQKVVEPITPEKKPELAPPETEPVELSPALIQRIRDLIYRLYVLSRIPQDEKSQAGREFEAEQLWGLLLQEWEYGGHNRAILTAIEGLDGDNKEWVEFVKKEVEPKLV